MLFRSFFCRFAKRSINELTFIVEAVEQNGWALLYANEDQKKDPEIALISVKNNNKALQFVDPSIKDEIAKLCGIDQKH